MYCMYPGTRDPGYSRRETWRVVAREAVAGGSGARPTATLRTLTVREQAHGRGRVSCCTGAGPDRMVLGFRPHSSRPLDTRPGPIAIAAMQLYLYRAI
eukprot:scaffold11462_cov140-Isochrysis_galbana.AAC.3